MVFLGRVIDNSNFGKSGTIEVLLPQKLVANGGEHLLSKGLHNMLTAFKKLLPKNNWSRGDKMTVSCVVSNPLGNAYNTGSFQLPQINTVGLVMQIQDYKTWGNIRYIWLGGIYGSTMYGEKVILPNDDTESDRLDYEDKALIVEKDEEDGRDTITNSDFMNKGEFIIKTKSSHISDPENPQAEEVDFKLINSDNTFVLKKDKAALRHNSYNGNDKEKLAELLINDNSLTIRRVIGKEKEENNRQEVKLEDDKMIVSFNNKDGNNVTITISEDGTADIKTTNNITVHSDSKIKFTSDDKMSFIANGKNLWKGLDNLIQDLINLKTQGSPSTHFVDITSKTSLQNEKNYIGAGYE